MSMSEDKKPKLLIIDSKSRTTHITREDISSPRVIEVEADRIVGLETTVALNGGYSVTVKYKGLPSDTLVFQNKAELLRAFNNLLLE